MAVSWLRDLIEGRNKKTREGRKSSAETKNFEVDCSSDSNWFLRDHLIKVITQASECTEYIINNLSETTTIYSDPDKSLIESLKSLREMLEEFENFITEQRPFGDIMLEKANHGIRGFLEDSNRFDSDKFIEQIYTFIDLAPNIKSNYPKGDFATLGGILQMVVERFDALGVEKFKGVTREISKKINRGGLVQIQIG